MATKLTEEQLNDAARLRQIFEVRKAQDKSWTQEKLAAECGWKTQSAAQQYMNGNVPLNLDALIKFATALDVSVTEISPSLGARIMSVRLPRESDSGSLSPQALIVAQAFERLPKAAQKAVLAQLAAFDVLPSADEALI
ncbi:helix-turn-helix domain-containing protein [Herbaspirillum sp. GCM10030257]|uniref:helix-turn-helix domain-containing protein n=1 Tax=Herbaspirillum sp. GCM10030257 TaxID=3273393 RepID=UPI00361EBF15